MSYDWSNATVVVEHKGFAIKRNYVGFGLQTVTGEHLLYQMQPDALKRMALALLLTAGTAEAVKTKHENFARVETEIFVDQVSAMVNQTMEFGVLALGGGELGAGSLMVPISEEAIRSLIRVLPRILQAISPPQTA